MADRTNRDRALSGVRRAGGKVRAAEAELLTAMRLAKDEGASLREIGDAAGVPHSTVAYRLATPTDEDAADA